MHDITVVCCSQVAAVTAESCDTVEGIANMGVAMKYAQPTQVRAKLSHAGPMHVGAFQSGDGWEGSVIVVGMEITRPTQAQTAAFYNAHQRPADNKLCVVDVAGTAAGPCVAAVCLTVAVLRDMMMTDYDDRC
jgi:hypothetical protein